MNDQDQINEEERQEAATETPAFLGCPQHMPTHLPGGFDGTEPAPSDEAKKALADGVERMRDKLSKIADIALAADAKCVNIEKIGKRWMECSKAICEIRKICGPDLIEKAVFTTGMYYTPGWLANLAKEVAARQKPIDPTAPEMKAAKQKEYFRKHFSFCDGLFPIRFTNTEDGQMASCWINGRHFTLDIDNNERDDGGNDCAANIRDNGKVVITIETQRGKSISGKVAYGAFKEYVRNLSGSGKYSSRGGFLKQAAKRAKAAGEVK